MDRWLTLPEVSRLPYVRRHEKTVRRHAQEGLLRAEKDPVSGRWRVLEAWAEECYAPRTAPNSAIDAPNNARSTR